MALMNLIEFVDEEGEEMVHRIPEQGSGEFKIGSQLIVRESQWAVFFRDGKAYDVFGPGRHTLTTLNIPLLTTSSRNPLFGDSPFKCRGRISSAGGPSPTSSGARPSRSSSATPSSR